MMLPLDVLLSSLDIQCDVVGDALNYVWMIVIFCVAVVILIVLVTFLIMFLVGACKKCKCVRLLDMLSSLVSSSLLYMHRTAVVGAARSLRVRYLSLSQYWAIIAILTILIFRGQLQDGQ